MTAVYIFKFHDNFVIFLFQIHEKNNNCHKKIDNLMSIKNSKLLKL